MVQYFPSITGSLTVTGSINLTGAITASGGISISGSIDSASYATVSTTAATASFANAFTVAGTLTAQTLVVQTITSSVDFVTGSTRFGSIAGNTHQFTGSVGISGNQTIVGSVTSTNQILNKSADGIFATFGGNTPKLNLYQFSAGNVMNYGHNFYYDGTNYGLNDNSKMGWEIRTHVGNANLEISSIAADTTTRSSRIFIDGTNGNVLIGTNTNIGTKLNVAGTISSYAATGNIRSYSTNPANDAIVFAGWTGETGIEMRYNPNSAISYIQNNYPITNGQAFGDIQFRSVNSGGSVNNLLLIKAYSGNVLINSTSDNGIGKLQVNGTSQASAFITTSGNTSVPFASWTNVYTLVNYNNAVYLFIGYLNGYTNYTCYATILQNDSGTIIANSYNSTLQVQMSGLNIQVYQNSGNTQTIGWKLIRIG